MQASLDAKTVQNLVQAYKIYQASAWYNPTTDLGSFIGFLQEQLVMQPQAGILTREGEDDG